MFAQDRDIAVLEPSVFKDVQWQTLTRSQGLASLSGLLLQATTIDVSFAAASVAAPAIVVVATVVMEVTAVVDATKLQVCKLRASESDAAVPLAIGGGALPFAVVTFAAQRAWAHERVMAMAGLRAGQEWKVLNPREAARLEALVALSMIYSAASATELANGAYAQRAALYARRVAEERQRTMLLLDHDGDGRADEQRVLHAGRMGR
jgi:hypothetical protein